MQKRNNSRPRHTSLIVEGPDSRYESYWQHNPYDTMEIADQKEISHDVGEIDRHHVTHSSTRHEISQNSNIHQPIGPIFHANYPFVVLDCANIGWSFGGASFSSLGIKIAFDTFHELPINLYGFIPASYVRKKPTDGSRGNSLMETEDWEIMDQLIRSRKLSVVPPGDSDDLYILNFAQHHDGYVISNDFFNDHLEAIESPIERQHAKEWLHHRRCSYTFTPEYDGKYSLMLNPSCELVQLLTSHVDLESDMTLET